MLGRPRANGTGTDRTAGREWCRGPCRPPRHGAWTEPLSSPATRRPNPVNDSGPSSKTGAVPLRRGLGACIDRATRMLQPLQTARDFDASSDEFGQRGALISWAHEQRRTVKRRAGALAIGALGRRCLEVGFSPGPARVIASLCGSDVGPRAGSWRVHGPADGSDSKSPRRLGATGPAFGECPRSLWRILSRFREWRCAC